VELPFLLPLGSMAGTASTHSLLHAEQLPLSALSEGQLRLLRGLGWALLLLRGGGQLQPPVQRAYLGLYEGQMLLLGTETEPPFSAAWLRLLADFHLPEQRQRWVLQLRRARYLRLLKLLPRAYRVRAEPPPPGAVLAGLGLTHWKDFPSLRGSGYSFYALLPDGSAHWCVADHTAEEWSAFSQLLLPGSLLLQLPGELPQQQVCAEYELRADGRVELLVGS
jgi:hypothetical protein